MYLFCSALLRLFNFLIAHTKHCLTPWPDQSMKIDDGKSIDQSMMVSYLISIGIGQSIATNEISLITLIVIDCYMEIVILTRKAVFGMYNYTNCFEAVFLVGKNTIFFKFNIHSNMRPFSYRIMAYSSFC